MSLTPVPCRLGKSPTASDRQVRRACQQRRSPDCLGQGRRSHGVHGAEILARCRGEIRWHARRFHVLGSGARGPLVGVRPPSLFLRRSLNCFLSCINGLRLRLNVCWLCLFFNELRALSVNVLWICLHLCWGEYALAVACSCVTSLFIAVFR